MNAFDSTLYLNGKRMHCRVRRAITLFARMRGLLGRPPLAQTQALLIAPCNSVHCIGMRYAIDVVYLSAQGDIVKLVPALRPWRMSACTGARQVLEFAAGAIAHYDLRVGQRLTIRVEEAVGQADRATPILQEQAP
jgi:uncharacterized membrane protein (UPF0127 family)